MNYTSEPGKWNKRHRVGHSISISCTDYTSEIVIEIDDIEGLYLNNITIMDYFASAVNETNDMAEFF